MIARYTIRFGPAVSQKELEKLLHTDLTPHETNRLSLMKARIEIVADFEDLKRLSQLLKDMASKMAYLPQTMKRPGPFSGEGLIRLLKQNS